MGRGTPSAGAVAQNGIFNNASQHRNHNLFWEMMGPGGKVMPGALEKALACQPLVNCPPNALSMFHLKPGPGEVIDRQVGLCRAINEFQTGFCLKGYFMVKLSCAVLVFATMFNLPSIANARTIQCEMQQLDRNLGWIAPRIEIEIDEDAGTIRVSDDFSQEYMGRRAKGVVDADNDARVTLRWNVTNQAAGGKSFPTPWKEAYRPSKIMFKLTMRKANGEANVVAEMPDVGGLNDPIRTAIGRCK